MLQVLFVISHGTDGWSNLIFKYSLKFGPASVTSHLAACWLFFFFRANQTLQMFFTSHRNSHWPSNSVLKLIETVWCITTQFFFCLETHKKFQLCICLLKIKVLYSLFYWGEVNVSVIIILRSKATIALLMYCWIIAFGFWPASMWFLNSLVPYLIKQTLSAQIFAHTFTRLMKG